MRFLHRMLGKSQRLAGQSGAPQCGDEGAEEHPVHRPILDSVRRSLDSTYQLLQNPK
jgi:hypothetical protein